MGTHLHIYGTVARAKEAFHEFADKAYFADFDKLTVDPQNTTVIVNNVIHRFDSVTRGAEAYQGSTFTSLIIDDYINGVENNDTLELIETRLESN